MFSGQKKRNVFCIVMFLAISLWTAHSFGGVNAGDLGSTGSNAVAGAVLYYHPSCPHCKKVIEYLHQNKKAVTLKNVSNPQYQKELSALGQKGVPVLVVNNRVIAGSTPIMSYLTRQQEAVR